MSKTGAKEPLGVWPFISRMIHTRTGQEGTKIVSSYSMPGKCYYPSLNPTTTLRHRYYLLPSRQKPNTQGG